MTDRRLFPFSGRVALVSLRGLVAAERFTGGEPARVGVPVADLLSAPGGARDRQLLWGEAVTVIDRDRGHAFVQSARDGYVGWLEEESLGPAAPATHWIAAPASQLYPAPDIKRGRPLVLSRGARLTVTGREGGFVVTDTAHFVPAQHLLPVGQALPDPVAAAADFLGTPYLWGGNSREGIDCSGLVQMACLACGIACPGDSDLQRQGLGTPLAEGTAPRGGDLLFWKGHVALVEDAATILHANAHAMAVVREDLVAACKRIADAGTPLISMRRLPAAFV